MLALERRATVHETGAGGAVEVRSQPFGGAIRILNLNTVRNLLGAFHFDSERSLAEQISASLSDHQPGPYCGSFVFSTSILTTISFLRPIQGRELVEEFAETLRRDLKPQQYVCKPLTTIVENEATPTDNIHAKGIPTVGSTVFSKPPSRTRL